MNHLSLKLSQHLSSLAPEMEGHWDWCGKYDEEDRLIGAPFVQCEEITGIDTPREWEAPMVRVICTAWQVEDLLRNIGLIANSIKTLQPFQIAEKIAWLYSVYPDTAYQKIEEYLWRVLSFDNDSQNAIDAFAYMLQAIKKAKNVLK